MSAQPALSMRLADLTRGRDNNLTLLRFLAATAVVYAHSFGLLELTHAEPFFRLFGKGIGDFGVDIFFVVSGLLVTKSLLGKETLGPFIWARVTRIFPALWISTLLWVVVVGAFLSPLGPEFWSQSTTLSYIAKNMTMLPGFGAQVNLPHAFAKGGPEFNVPLWTLPHELQMYGLLVLSGLLGIVRRRWIVSIIVAAAFACMVQHEFGIGSLIDETRARFVFFFFSGVSIYLFRDRIHLKGSVATGCCLLVGVLLLNPGLEVRRLALAGVTPYLVVWFAFVPRGPIRRYNVVGDYSYGIYILAFPVQLILRNVLGIKLPMLHFAASLCCVLPLAILSWHLIEQRALHFPAPTFLRRLLNFRPVRETPAVNP